MSTVVTLELPDSVYEPLVQVAEKAELPLEEWILARLMRHAGAVNLGHPTGVDNESIDADLAWSLMSHEGS
jgi:hypothetical protein